MNTINDLLMFIRNNVDLSMPAIICGEDIQNYAGFIEEIDIISSSFRQIGFKKGDTCVLFLDGSPFLLKSVLAVARLGGIFASISPKLPFATICEFIRYIKPKILLTQDIFFNVIKVEFPEALIVVTENSIKSFAKSKCEFKSEIIHADDSCGIILTSGTTNLPKGVIHSHKNFLTTGENCATTWGIKKTDRLLSMIPLMTAVTFGSLVMPALLSGATIVVSKNRKDYTIIDKYKVSFLMGNPTNFMQLLESIDCNWSGHGRGTIAGALIPAGLLEKVEAKIGYYIYPHYGMTELLAVTTALDNKSSSVGKPFNGISIRIEDASGNIVEDGVKGEVVCKSPSAFKGYINDTVFCKKETWFKTGDIGFIDCEGNLALAGRLKNCIIRCGNNVYPEEIEFFANKYKSIRECAVVGVPHDIYGEAIVLCIVPSNDVSIKEDEIRDYLLNYLPLFKIPDIIKRIDDIPKTFNGKISRQKLKEKITTL